MEFIVINVVSSVSEALSGLRLAKIKSRAPFASLSMQTDLNNPALVEPKIINYRPGKPHIADTRGTVAEFARSAATEIDAIISRNNISGSSDITKVIVVINETLDMCLAFDLAARLARLGRRAMYPVFDNGEFFDYREL